MGRYAQCGKQKREQQQARRATKRVAPCKCVVEAARSTERETGVSSMARERHDGMGHLRCLSISGAHCFQESTPDEEKVWGDDGRRSTWASESGRFHNTRSQSRVRFGFGMFPRLNFKTWTSCLDFSGFLWIMCILQAVSRRAVLFLYSSRQIGGRATSAISAPDFFPFGSFFPPLDRSHWLRGQFGNRSEAVVIGRQLKKQCVLQAVVAVVQRSKAQRSRLGHIPPFPFAGGPDERGSNGSNRCPELSCLNPKRPNGPCSQTASPVFSTFVSRAAV